MTVSQHALQLWERCGLRSGCDCQNPGAKFGCHLKIEVTSNLIHTLLPQFSYSRPRKCEHASPVLLREPTHMTLSNQLGKIRLTPYPTYEERGVALDRCPNCHNERIAKTPRGKNGPGMFHCRRCGYLTNIDLVFSVHRQLGHKTA